MYVIYVIVCNTMSALFIDRHCRAMTSVCSPGGTASHTPHGNIHRENK